MANVTAPSSSHQEKLINNNTSLTEYQAQKAQGTTIKTPPMHKPFVHPMEDTKVSWYANAIGELCFSNNTEAVQLTDARCCTAEEVGKMLYVKAETEYVIQNKHLKPIGDRKIFTG